MPRIIGAKAPKESLTVRLSADLVHTIRTEASSINWSISEFVEAAITEGLVEIMGGGLILEPKERKERKARKARKK